MITAFLKTLGVTLAFATLPLTGLAQAEALPAKSPGEPAAPQNTAESATVKIFSTVQSPDLMKPWAKQAPREATGTGVIIEGNRILTAAHVVLYATEVQVQAHQSGDKVSATVEAIAPGIDLAVLKVEDAFFENRPPMARSPALPVVKDTVVVYGFPTGGTSLSITKGIVSRIEFAGYAFPVSGLRVQIDAAVNPGNSGGPALVGDKMIGLAFSRLGGADNIGYIVPSEEIELFLQDVADGRYDGKATLLDTLQSLENPALRAFLKLGKTVEGIVVREPYEDDPAYALKTWDVISKIGDVPVDNQGMIKLGANLRVRFTYLVHKLAKEGKVPLRVWRDGKEIGVDVPVQIKPAQLFANLEGTYPEYFVCGPLVLSKVTTLFASAIGSNAKASATLSSRSNPLVTRRGDKPKFEGEELVVVAAPLFPHKLSKGYSNPFSRVLETINGIKVKNLRHAVELLRDSKEEFLVFEFDQKGGESLVLPREETLAATEDILVANGIRAQGSAGLMSAWNAKP